jgi:hypothetical protein
MPTIEELFKNKELNFPGGTTADGLVDSSAQENRGGFKQQVKNFAEQELSGVRVKSLVELNNPLIYGNQATRIAKRSTPDKDTMLNALGSEEGGGLSKVIGKATDAVNSFLGIPVTLLPSRMGIEADDEVGKDGKTIKDNPTNEAYTKETWGKNGTGLGALLKASGGNPSTLGKQAVGGALKAGKDAIRGAIFGKRSGGPIRDTEPATYFDKGDGTTDDHRTDILKNKEADILGKMGIGMDAIEDRQGALFYKSKKPRTHKTPLYNVTSEDEVLQIPFWIQSLNPQPSDKKYGDKKIEDDKMFFRTTVSGLSETVTPTWSGNKFIGNPHNYYIYEGVERAITFNLNIYCNDSNELALNWQRIDFLTRQTYPSYGGENLDIINAPFIKFQLGDVYKDRTGFIESLTYTVPDNGNWEIDTDGLKLPKFIDVSMTIKLVETPGIETELYNYGGTPKTF